MNHEIQVRLPYPPSVNDYWRRTARGGMMVSPRGLMFRDDVAVACVDFRGFYLGHERLAVVIHATMPDKRRRDVDNILKASLDALESAGVYHDDSQIDELTVRRAGRVAKPGWLDVTIGIAEPQYAKGDA